MLQRKLLSAHRNELKGLAILMVLFFHINLQCGPVLFGIKQLCYSGVDIFMFLSGYGLYHSLRGSNDLKRFWTKRFSRILPAYLPIVVCWMIVMYPTYHLSNSEILRGVAGNLSTLGYWIQTPKMYNWYVGAMMMFYLLAPVVYALLSQSAHPARMTVSLMLGACLMGVAFIDLDAMMCISRLPIFILGMFFAMDLPWKIKPLPLSILYGLLMLGGIAVEVYAQSNLKELLITYGLYWYPFVLATPGLCLCWCVLTEGLKRSFFSFLTLPFKVLGECSFEIYLVHIWIYEIAHQYESETLGYWIPIQLLSCGIGIACHFLIVFLRKRFSARKAFT